MLMASPGGLEGSCTGEWDGMGCGMVEGGIDDAIAPMRAPDDGDPRVIVAEQKD